jgi:alanyl-tRNA synthetase
MIFGKDKVTTGASSDIKMVSDIARRMVTEWGLSEKLGFLAYSADEQEVFLGRSVSQQKNLSDSTAKIIDEEISGVKIRFQKVEGLPPKELRKLVDDGKKELIEGIVIVFASKDDKVGVAVGITNKLTEKYDAVKFVKISSEIIGGQGGGGRKDFAQAGGLDQSKIDQAFEQLKTLI